MAFQILKRAGCNIFESMPKENFVMFRKYVIHGITNTDMMLHKPMVTDIQLLVDRNKFEPIEGTM